MTTEDSARLAWFKSTYSGNEGGACLELATTPNAVHVRDSKKPTRAQIVFTRQSWAAFAGFTGRPR
ncbi:DUF397 domain-containing protein [Streptomyces sp. NPDC047000]|uniref:DUF397 domain-containing protein n=1 Tax=Streptomyces sp. NPDC047000 TaxID=3155474 RepID=UPI0033FFA7F8